MAALDRKTSARRTKPVSHPCEDWSWCFDEAGYFAAVNPAPSDRHIYRLIRPDVTSPIPLGGLQW